MDLLKSSTRPAGLVQIGVGAGPAVVGVGVVPELLDQPVEVPDGLFELLALDTRKRPWRSGRRRGPVPFPGRRRSLLRLVVDLQGHVGQTPGDEGTGLPGWRARDRPGSRTASSWFPRALRATPGR